MSNWVAVQRLIHSLQQWLLIQLDECLKLHKKCEQKLENLVNNMDNRNFTSFLSLSYQRNLERELKEYKQFYQKTADQIKKKINSITQTSREIILYIQTIIQGIEQSDMETKIVEEILNEFHKVLSLIEEHHQDEFRKYLIISTLLTGSVVTCACNPPAGIAMAVGTGVYLFFSQRNSADILNQIQRRRQENRDIRITGNAKILQILDRFSQSLIEKS